MTAFPPEQNLRAIDLFPDLSEELDRRISHAETRVKYWVLVGVIVNFLVAVAAAVPVVYSSGQIAADIRTSLSTQQAQSVELAARAKWMEDRMIWEARVEAALEAQNIDLPKSKRNNP